MFSYRPSPLYYWIGGSLDSLQPRMYPSPLLPPRVREVCDDRSTGWQSLTQRRPARWAHGRCHAPACRGRGPRTSARRPGVAEGARGGERLGACVPVAHPRCSVACNASPPSQQGCRTSPSRPYCCPTHALSTACLSGTALALFLRHNTKKTALTTSVLKHKEASYGRVESVAGDASVAP